MHIDDLRPALLSAGFHEAARRPGHFYRPDTEWTAFALHMKETPEGLSIEYGWASTAFVRMDGPDALPQWGCLDINLHEHLCIPADADAEASAAPIRALYAAHRGTEKDALLTIVRKQRADRKKAIVARIDAQMKPLGLRRRGARWELPLTGGFCLCLALTCSSWAEEYGLELDIARADAPIKCCYACEFHLPGRGNHRFDWQTTPADLADGYIRDAVGRVRDLLNAPLAELGRDPSIWMHCHCTRQKCATCWVEKNVWEARHP